jgi:hypothetical protein
MRLPINYDKASWQKRKNARDQYVKNQEGRCHYCDELLTEIPERKTLAKPVDRGLFPDGFFDWPIHLHHNHNTGMTIGACHAHCNAVMWFYHGE